MVNAEQQGTSMYPSRDEAAVHGFAACPQHRKWVDPRVKPEDDGVRSLGQRDDGGRSFRRRDDGSRSCGRRDDGSSSFGRRDMNRRHLAGVFSGCLGYALSVVILGLDPRIQTRSGGPPNIATGGVGAGLAIRTAEGARA